MHWVCTLAWSYSWLEFWKQQGQSVSFKCLGQVLYIFYGGNCNVNYFTENYSWLFIIYNDIKIWDGNYCQGEHFLM